MTLKLITFDITGTLVALKKSVGYHYAKIGSVYGINVPPDRLSTQFVHVFKELLVEQPNFGEKTGIGWQEWWKLLVFRTFKNSSTDKTVLQSSTIIDQIASDLTELFKTKECWKLEDGAQHLLDMLRSKNIRLGVISNYDPRLEDILIDLSIREYFNFVLTSYDAKCEKPDSGIYKTVEHMNADLEKKEILHIGDNPKLDYVGAKNVGWNAILIAKNINEVKESFSDIEEQWVVKNISDVYYTLQQNKLL